MAEKKQGSEIMLWAFYKLGLDFGFTFIFCEKKKKRSAGTASDSHNRDDIYSLE